MKKANFIYPLILAMFLWGGGWSALKVLTQNLEMEVIVFWRFFIMSLSFLPILYFVKEPLRLNKQKVKFIASSSVLNIAFMVSSFFGIKYGLAGSGGVIITTLSPIVTFLFMAVFFKNKIYHRQYIGLLIGIVGGFIMLELNDISLFLNSSNIYFLLCAIIWAGVTILSQHSHQHISPIHYSFFISIVATIATFIYAFSLDFDLLGVFTQDTTFWVAMIYLAVLGQSVATTIFFIASGKLGSQKTSSFMFLVPIFALLIASILLQEPIETHILLGGALSLIAVFFINKK
jgi:drug/metabolite transporter (DMT)-like permease